jgi:hypothetical protein
MRISAAVTLSRQMLWRNPEHIWKISRLTILAPKKSSDQAKAETAPLCPSEAFGHMCNEVLNDIKIPGDTTVKVRLLSSLTRHEERGMQSRYIAILILLAENLQELSTMSTCMKAV